MGESVERACQQVEGEDVECVCGGTCIGADSSMLQCDSCKGWYAVAISALDAKSVPIDSALDATIFEWFEWLVSKLTTLIFVM